MASLPRSRPALLAVTAGIAVVLVVGFLWFRPDALFTDRIVEEDLDPALAAALATSPGPVPSTSGARSPDDASSPRSGTPTPPARSPTTSAATTDSATEPPTEPPTPTPGAERPASPAPSPEPREPSRPDVLARGEWISLEHDTTGSVALVDDDGDLRVVLAELATSNGPDLHVILSPKAGVAGDWYGYEDGATYLGGLKGNRGTQVYDVPDDLDPADVASVVIWCERFSVGFGAANLA